jgi:hypothetical protein
MLFDIDPVCRSRVRNKLIQEEDVETIRPDLDNYTINEYLKTHIDDIRDVIQSIVGYTHVLFAVIYVVQN